MDNKSIFSKTGKGSLEISKKSIKLSSEERQALILVDGKTNFGELQEKLSRVSPPKLRAVFEKLVELELIREFVAKNDPPAAPPPVGAISVRELDGGSDLDFTALAPAPAAVDPAKEVEARRKAAAEAEEEARKVREAILRKEQERKAAEEEARRRAEAERKQREEAARRAAEEEAQRKAEAERLAREQREREERERLERERQEKERQEREAAARRAAEEEARRKAEAERLAREQREREERERLERERQEKERQEREAAARRAAEEEARRKAEAERLAREQREREERERLERERQEKERQEREAAARRAAEDEARRKAAAEQHAREERELEERHRAEREKLERDRLARQREEEERAAALMASQAAQAAVPAPSSEPASLDFNSGATPPSSDSLDFAPAASERRRKEEVEQLLAAPGVPGLEGATPLAGGPDTFADTGSVMDPFADDDVKASKEKEVASRKEIEQEAKERAKAEAKAKKEAEREAKRLAKESRVKVSRSGPSIGVIVAGLAVVSIVGGVGYLFMMPVDKAAIERAMSERLGEAVTVDNAKFSPFPPELALGGVSIGTIKLNNVIARPDPTSLISDHKIWKTVEVQGLATNVEGARAVLALGTREVSKIAASRTEIQRIRITNIDVSGLPISIPKFNLDVALGGTGSIKQVSLATPDDKARASLQPEGEKWLVDVESRGMAWPVGPKIAWESVRAKGSANSGGLKFEEYTITHFGGSSRGAGELTWSGNWKFGGNLDLGNLESEALAQAFYGVSPVSGNVEGKLSISLNGTTLAKLFDSPQIDGAVNVSKAVVKNIDLARTAQTGAAAPGATRFTDFSATVAASAGKLALKDVKGVSGLLTVSGTTEIASDKALGGNLTVELGVGGSRAKANVRLSGNIAEPKFTK